MPTLEEQIENVEKKIEVCEDLEERKLLREKERQLREEKLILLRTQEKSFGVADPASSRLVISVPAMVPFTTSVDSCQNTFKIAENKTYDLIDMERVVECVKQNIDHYLPKVTDNQLRVPPVALSRMARSGKTTTLSSLFDELKKSTNIKVIGISCNGQRAKAFRLRGGETQCQALLRLIAAQLISCTPEETHNLVVDRAALDAYLGDNVVLLIDELNRLTGGMPLDVESATLLRDMFLDRAGRYLVYSTHLSINVDNNVAAVAADTGPSNEIEPSLRGILTVDMSLAHTVEQLQKLPGCSALTSYQASWFGYIPALVLTAMAERVSDITEGPSRRFAETEKTVPHEEIFSVLKLFVAQLMTGKGNAVLRKYFGTFSSMGMDKKISYPLCYAKEIFSSLQPDAVPEVISVFKRLEAIIEQEGTGLDFECTIQLAVLFKCHAAEWFGLPSPFDIVPTGVKPILKYIKLDSKYKTLGDARSFIDGEVSKCTSPTLFYVSWTYACFEAVDGLVVYTNGEVGEKRVVKKFGFQTKAGDNKNVKVIDPADLDHCFLFRGSVLAANPSSTPKDRWTYYTVEDVIKFIGVSLQLAVPRDMLLSPPQSKLQKQKKEKKKKTDTKVQPIYPPFSKKFSTLSGGRRGAMSMSHDDGLLSLGSALGGSLFKYQNSFAMDRHQCQPIIVPELSRGVSVLLLKDLHGKGDMEFSTVRRAQLTSMQLHLPMAPSSTLRAGVARVTQLTRFLFKK